MIRLLAQCPYCNRCEIALDDHPRAGEPGLVEPLALDFAADDIPGAGHLRQLGDRALGLTATGRGEPEDEQATG